MAVKKDIRILTLQKQHYFDIYDGIMESDYSCWGYYDGISIVKPSEGKNQLFEKRSDAPVSSLWYGSGESIRKLDGRHSRQNIGIFRGFSEEKEEIRAEEFWKKYESSPYFAAGFVKLGDMRKYKETGSRIEEKTAGLGQDDIYVDALIYDTFDNADLILLIVSNSLTELERAIGEIRDMGNVCYMYSVMGVNERYLAACEENVIGEWNGVSCHISEPVARIAMRAATAGKKGTLEKLGGQIRNDLDLCRPGGADNVPIHSMITSGHQTSVLEIRDLTVGEILSLFVPKGTLTHNNALYGKEIYNIETEINISSEEIEPSERGSLDDSKPQEQGTDEERKDGNNKKSSWCGTLIDKYEKKMDLTFESKDESFYSYYKAMIQTLNTLAQYEGFPMSKDMFYLLYPAFDMFDRQLDHALNVVKETKKPEQITELKKSICDFINAVNSIIYHTIHTDQIFLMIPGYSGTSFSIPIKLCLAYLWLANRVTLLLNDKDYEYNCFITPEMESCPDTMLIDFGVPRSDRLICFRSSQRSLYMPRHFITILTHEIAHYAGTDIRKRKKRAECIIRTLVYFLGEGVFPEKELSRYEEDSEESRYVRTIYIVNKKRAMDRAVDYLTDKMMSRDKSNQYHATDIRRPLEEGCLEFLSDETEGIYPDIYRIPGSIMCEIKGENIYKKARLIERIQSRFDANRRSLLTSGVMEKIIDELILVYREVFSDIAAVSILKCDEVTFKESYDVSEGNKDGRSRQQKVRDRIAEYVFWGRERGQFRDDNENQKQMDEPKEEEDGPKRLYQKIYDYVWVEEHLLQYAMECRDAIQVRLENADKGTGEKNFRNELAEIRDFYNLFSQKKEESESWKNCQEIYDCMMENIKKYISETKAKISGQ